MVTLLVNDQPARFILDTGAERTIVTVAAVRRLGLTLDRWVGTTVMGIGGLERHQNAIPQSISLGGLALRQATLLHDSSVAVGVLPLEGFGGRIDGLLGRDLLSSFDLLLDIPARTLTLYDVRDCRGSFVPWTTSYTTIPAFPDYGKALVIAASVDGHGMRALLDSGAGTTLVTAPGMARLGLTPEALATDGGGLARGIGRAQVPVRLHRFTTLGVGTEVSRNPIMMVAPVHVVPIVDLVLGTDWLQSHRVWLSYSTLQVFVGGT